MDEFDEICRRCTPVVYRFLLSLCKDASLADELTAETFYQAYWVIRIISRMYRKPILTWFTM